MNDPLTPDRVSPLFRSSFGQKYRFKSSVDSTQNELHDNDPEGTIVVADQQLKGRGRHGKTWMAPSGRALLMSIRLHLETSQPAMQIALVVGVLLAEIVEREINFSTSIKWPNDILVKDKKVAGILVEQRRNLVSLGIGINVNQTKEELPTGTHIKPISLRIIDGKIHDRAKILATIAEELEFNYRVWQEKGLNAFTTQIQERDALFGRRVRVGSLHGIAAGIAPNGSLVVDIEGKHEMVTSGEVHIEK